MGQPLLRPAPRPPAPEARSTRGKLIYAVGDIHGRYDLLKQLLGDVSADAERWGQKPTLVFLGDYVDRGPDSARVLQALWWLRRWADFEVHLLKGNHEAALLRFIHEPESGVAWLNFGGRETLAAYGVEAPEQASASELRRLCDEFLEKLPSAHLLLLQSLHLHLEIGDYLFVHAGVRPGVALEHQTEEDLLWIRQDFLAAPGPFERVVVHGHTWIDDKPAMLEHRIGADTGAYATGALTAVRLQDGEVGVLQARLPVAA